MALRRLLLSPGGTAQSEPENYAVCSPRRPRSLPTRQSSKAEMINAEKQSTSRQFLSKGINRGLLPIQYDLLGLQLQKQPLQANSQGVPRECYQKPVNQEKEYVETAFLQKLFTPQDILINTPETEESSSSNDMHWSWCQLTVACRNQSTPDNNVSKGPPHVQQYKQWLKPFQKDYLKLNILNILAKVANVQSFTEPIIVPSGTKEMRQQNLFSEMEQLLKPLRIVRSVSTPGAHQYRHTAKAAPFKEEPLSSRTWLAETISRTH